MKIMDVVSEDGLNECLLYLNSLSDDERESEFDDWIDVISIDYEPNEFQKKILVYFSEWLDTKYWPPMESDIDNIARINSLKNDINSLVDQTLDILSVSNCGESKKVIFDILDEMNKSITDCDDLNKFYNEKIINNDC